MHSRIKFDSNNLVGLGTGGLHLHLKTMANSAAAVCLLALLAFSVDAQRSRGGIVSVGTFNALLIPGSTAIEARKELFIQTVSELKC